MVIAVLLAAVSAIVVIACVQHARAQGWKAAGLPAINRSRGLPSPPADDLPPAGLAPLIPSQRAIASELERGLRELTFFLAVPPRD